MSDFNRNIVPFDTLHGLVLTECYEDKSQNAVVFKTAERTYTLKHSQECCEFVVVDE